jgi:CRP-like cAMP-binding protein
LPRRSSSVVVGPAKPRTREVLIREGDVGEGYYVVESGQLSVTWMVGLSDRADRATVSARSPSSGMSRTATVTAVSVVLLTLGRADFLKRSPGIHRPMTRRAASSPAARPT